MISWTGIAIPASYYDLQNHIWATPQCVRLRSSLSHRDALALLSIAAWGLSLAAGLLPSIHVGIGLLLAGSGSGLFPPWADASNCTKHRRGERLIQVVCIKPGFHDSWGQVGLCSEQIWGLSVCWPVLRGMAPSSPPHFPACQQLPRDDSLQDPHPEAHLISACQLICCTTGHGGDGGGGSQGQPSCLSLRCPLCHCLSPTGLLLTQWLAGGKLCRSPALFGSLTQGGLLCGEWLLPVCFCSLSLVLPYFYVD